MNENKQKSRLAGADFVRAFCAIGIVMFHFYVTAATEDKLCYTYANGAWGGLLVTVFFIISGAMLYYNHSEIKNLKSFYIKRWKSLFPPFYIAYIIFFIRNVYLTGMFFWAGSPVKLILTALGMDGYLYYLHNNYYIIGEWFLGAIIILYLIYPLLLWVFKKNALITGGVILAAYIWMCITDFFTILPEQNGISNILSFYIGMLIIKYRRQILDNKYVLIVSAVISTILFFVRFPRSTFINIDNILMHVLGFTLFITLYHVGNIIMKAKPLSRVVSFVGGISYHIFLLQHMLIVIVLERINPLNGFKAFVLFLIVTLITIIGAWLLKELTKAITKLLSKPFIDRKGNLS